MPHVPNRRWFKFSLRTMFVVTTVLACWLGWNLHRVRQREEILQYASQVCSENNPSVADDVPIAWRLLGAEPVWWVLLPGCVPKEELMRVQSLFPEAICVMESQLRICRDEVPPAKILPDELAVLSVVYHFNWPVAAVAVGLIVLAARWMSPRSLRRHVVVSFRKPETA